MEREASFTESSSPGFHEILMIILIFS